MLSERRLSSAEFADMEFRSKATGKAIHMADYSLANDLIGAIPIIFKDAAGSVIAKQTGGTVVSSDTTIATAAVVVGSAGSDTVEVTPVADGEVTVTYSHQSIADAVGVIDIIEPSPASDAFDFANATTRPKV
jgi:hypothetical protein